jgi:hypothetical protein
MKYCLAILLLFSIAGHSRADAPLPAPEILTFCSANKQFCAVSDPVKRITRVSSKRFDKTLWSIPGWHRWVILSNDGESMVIAHSGINLVPSDVTLREPVLRFYSRGQLVRAVTLGDLYKTKSELVPTVSHFAWVRAVGFNKANQLVVELVSGKKVAFAARTGRSQRLIPDGP